MMKITPIDIDAASVGQKAGMAVKESFGWYDKTLIEEIRREIIFMCGKE